VWFLSRRRVDDEAPPAAAGDPAMDERLREELDELL
jgi:hypothetical protein